MKDVTAVALLVYTEIAKLAEDYLIVFTSLCIQTNVTEGIIFFTKLKKVINTRKI